jgi:hypothetical protein
MRIHTDMHLTICHKEFSDTRRRSAVIQGVDSVVFVFKCGLAL